MGIHSELLERHRRVLPDWVALYYAEPISLVDGEGHWATDAEGNRYLDFFCGILVNMLGFRHPRVTAALKAQADKMVHASTCYLMENQIKLAEQVCELSGIPDAKVFFTNSGTEANDTALMIASQYRGSNQMLALRHSYHGKSHSAAGVTGTATWSATSYSPFQTTYIHGGYKRRSPFGHLPEDEYIARCADDLREMLRVAVSGSPAAMIAEPIQGVSGFVTPPDGLFGAFKEILDEHGALFISDEVQTGWGRTGENFWGYGAHGVTPDLLTFAKGLGNGMAIGGVVGRGDLIDSYPALGINTFGGNPMSTAAGLATLETLLEEDLQTNAYKVGNRLKNQLDGLSDEVPEMFEVRGKGLMLGVEMADPDTGAPRPELAGEVMEQARERGLLVGKGGVFGNVLRIAPPLSLTEEESDLGGEMLEGAIRQAVGR